jgi:G protein-coupled receptor 139
VIQKRIYDGQTPTRHHDDLDLDIVTSSMPEVTTARGLVYYTLVNEGNVLLNHFNYWIQAILFKLIPCVLLTTLTVLLLITMRQANARRAKLKSQGRRDESDRARECNRTTTMLVAVVGLFQLTEFPQGVLTLGSIFVSEFYQNVYSPQGVLTLGSIFVSEFYQNVYSPLGDLLDIMALLNNSINFILYCTMSSQFRRTFVNTLCGRKD